MIDSSGWDESKNAEKVGVRVGSVGWTWVHLKIRPKVSLKLFAPPPTFVMFLRLCFFIFQIVDKRRAEHAFQKWPYPSRKNINCDFFMLRLCTKTYIEIKEKVNHKKKLNHSLWIIYWKANIWLESKIIQQKMVKFQHWRLWIWIACITLHFHVPLNQVQNILNGWQVVVTLKYLAQKMNGCQQVAQA